MKKTYVTKMPDHMGAFLQASRLLAALNINITRVSYNKAIDAHTLFIDAEGTEAQLAEAEMKLSQIGYLQGENEETSLLLLEFKLRDVPGGVLKVLELIARHQFNISYMSSVENQTDYQHFQMGLLVENLSAVSEFLTEVEQLCPVRVIDYNRSEKFFDNSIFYSSFVSNLLKSGDIPQSFRNELLVNVNLAMQTLDEQGLSPYQTFDSIGRFANMLAGCRGKAFRPRVSRHAITDKTELTLIEPPCGSNTAILHNGDELLLIDCGYAYYRQEMMALFRELFPDFDRMQKTMLITHADVDHCGLLPDFNTIIASGKSAECIRAEYEKRPGFREQNRLHKPYIAICKVLTGYIPVDPSKIFTPWRNEGSQSDPLWQIGYWDFCDLHFEVYEGKGGHLSGEIVLIDYAHHIAFTGDIYVNMKDMHPDQKQYNQYAPVLMTSVDTDPALCSQERQAIFQRLGLGDWRIFGSHGAGKAYNVQMEREKA